MLRQGLETFIKYMRYWSSMTLAERLHTLFPKLTFLSEEPLKAYTTVGIGGPAEAFCKLQRREDLIAVCTKAYQEHIPVTLLGWGANTLIADRGVRGLVIRNECQAISVHPEPVTEASAPAPEVASRWSASNQGASFKYDFADLEFDESQVPRVRVTCDAGVALPMALNTLIAQGITGLQWYSRIPATIGGAVYNNIHGGTHFISEVLESVEVLTPQGELQVLPTTALAMGYDTSRFHTSGEIIISATFVLYKGDAQAARAVALEWAQRKKLQPQNSLGCIFQNISAEQQAALGFHTPSIGYIIEHALALQGYCKGDACVSSHHAAFIENRGTATAADYLAVIRTIISAAQTKLQLKLTPEIFFKGFTPEELAGIV